ncbi:MAG: family 10 glycosylhydrolase [Vicinamibacterales bacterium]
MRLRRAGPGLLATAVLVAMCVSASVQAGAPLAVPDPEVRAMWVLRTSLTSSASIETLIKTAKDHGFNTLLVQVRGRGDAYYRGGLEPMPADLLRQPDTFDPLAAVLKAARPAGLRVHAWINLNLISSAVELPVSRDHLVYRHPDWLMVPRDIAQDLAASEINSPGYLGKLARWTRAQSTEVEGLYVSPVLPASVAYTESVVRDVATRYAVDGIHFDYARYPNDRFDYSRAAIKAFRADVRPSLADVTRRALDAQAAIDLFAYPDALPDQWREFRIARMTALMVRLSATVRDARPAAIVSVAAAPELGEARSRKMQDWGAWLSSGVIDALCPMAYTREAARFAEQIGAAKEAAGSRAVWAGIGAYRLSPEQTIENIRTARRLGAAGVVLFSYDSLVNPRQTAPGYLSTIGRGAFAEAIPIDTTGR